MRLFAGVPARETAVSRIPTETPEADEMHRPIVVAFDPLGVGRSWVEIEWSSDHVRIDELLVSGPLDPRGGGVRSDVRRPGHRLQVRAGAERFRTHP